jgi:nucleoid DNA-binding protein
MAGSDMPRKTVIAQVARQHGVSKVEAEKIVRTVLESVAAELAARGRFHIAEVGSVTVAERPPRRYFNPRTGEESVSGGGKALKINISKHMKARLD